MNPFHQNPIHGQQHRNAAEQGLNLDDRKAIDRAIGANELGTIEP